MKNYVFTFCALNISYEILKMPRLSNELFSQYAGVANFKADMHNVFIQARTDKKHACWKFPYMVIKEDILAVVQQWLAEWMKDAGTKPNIPFPPVTNVGAGPSQTQKQYPPKDSTEQSESQQSEGDQGGDSGAGEEEEESVKTISDPNRPDKRKSPEAEEVTMPQFKKKAKVSKGKNIVQEPTVMMEELD